MKDKCSIGQYGNITLVYAARPAGRRCGASSDRVHAGQILPLTGFSRNIAPGARLPLQGDVDQENIRMSGTSDKIKGAANEAIGKAKQGVGEAVGSDRMKADGAAQETKGDAQKVMGDAKNATKKAVDDTAEAVKKPL